jgi:hypothetical protein
VCLWAARLSTARSYDDDGSRVTLKVTGLESQAALTGTSSTCGEAIYVDESLWVRREDLVFAWYQVCESQTLPFCWLRVIK